MNHFFNRMRTGATCYVIAEAGVNHNADLELAKKLVIAAKESGAHAVKFQTFRAKELALPGPHHDMLAGLELPREWYPELKTLAERADIDFLSSPFDMASARFLAKLGVRALKIGSGELTHLSFLRDVSTLGLPLIISTGMANEDECLDAKLVVPDDAAWLHCVSAYPASISGYNLKCMDTLRSLCCGGIFSGVVGLSDHTIGDTVAIAAVALGAQILEKHLTLDNSLPGPDHACSMLPADFAVMTKKLRDVHSALGNGKKTPTPEEIKTMPVARRVKTDQGWRRNP